MFQKEKGKKKSTRDSSLQRQEVSKSAVTSRDLKRSAIPIEASSDEKKLGHPGNWQRGGTDESEEPT